MAGKGPKIAGFSAWSRDFPAIINVQAEPTPPAPSTTWPFLTDD
jgi:hypothetical protein